MREEHEVVEHALAHGLAEGVGGHREQPAQSAPTRLPGRPPPSPGRSSPRATAGRAGRRGCGRPPPPPRATSAPRAFSATSSVQRSPSLPALLQLAGRAGRPASSDRPLTQDLQVARRRGRGSRRGGPPPPAGPRAAAPRGRTASRRRRGCASRRTRSCPCALRSRMMSRTRRRPIGSRPDIGSSRKTSSGSFMSAWASPTRCSMPLEKRRSGTSRGRGRARRARGARRRAARRRRLAHAEEPADVVEVLARRQVVVEVRVLRQVADALAPARIVERAARGAGRSPASGEDEAHQDLQRRGLARAVRPEVAEDLAPRDGRGSGRAGPGGGVGRRCPTR